MVRLTVLPLDAPHAAQLQAWQAEIDAVLNYPARVDLAKARFSQRNRRGDASFTHVKDVLSRMCFGPRRCAYCEDSAADEVEHIRPKDLYPEQVFAWDNYVYACGPCNGPKNNKFAVIAGDPPQKIDVTRKRNVPVLPPARVIQLS